MKGHQVSEIIYLHINIRTKLHMLYVLKLMTMMMMMIMIHLYIMQTYYDRHHQSSSILYSNKDHMLGCCDMTFCSIDFYVLCKKRF